MKLFDSVLRSKVRPSLPGTKCCRDWMLQVPRQHWEGPDPSPTLGRPDASQLGNLPPPPQHLNCSLRPSPNNILSVILEPLHLHCSSQCLWDGKEPCRVVSLLTGFPSTLSHHPYYSFVNPELDRTTSPPSCHREQTNPSSCGHPISGPRLPSTENLRSRQTSRIAVAI